MRYLLVLNVFVPRYLAFFSTSVSTHQRPSRPWTLVFAFLFHGSGPASVFLASGAKSGESRPDRFGNGHTSRRSFIKEPSSTPQGCRRPQYVWRVMKYGYFFLRPFRSLSISVLFHENTTCRNPEIAQGRVTATLRRFKVPLGVINGRRTGRFSGRFLRRTRLWLAVKNTGYNFDQVHRYFFYFVFFLK